MRIILIGADYEENLGVGAIAAACKLAGHQVVVLPFNESSEVGAITATVTSKEPEVVGLSIQFQHRSFDFLFLAKSLRAAGYKGHITCGGQFPTMAYREVLRDWTEVDSIVLHDGETAIVELVDALLAAKPLSHVAGLAIRDRSGLAVRTPGRRLAENLDALPIPSRYRDHSKGFDIAFIPIMGSRGCWGACAFCSISTLYRDARDYAGARLMRYRSPRHIAAEMALLWHEAKGKAVFCFHDDNFLLPRPKDSLERLRFLREALDEFGVGNVSMIGKCRPETLTAELAKQLSELGVIRLYVGVENCSYRGAEHLNRKVQSRKASEALAACRNADIFACYNLLLFEPEATLDDVEENIAFIREHASHPVNFCRAEAYYGTPLHNTLKERNNLKGSYLGYDYRITDDRAELLFRICAATFRQRNFHYKGVHNRYMGIGYQAKLLRTYYPDIKERLDELSMRADRLTRSISMETAGFMEQALELAYNADLGDRERIERETALLGLRIAEADAERHAEIDDLSDAMERYSGQCRRPRFVRLGRERMTRIRQQVIQSVALGSWIVTVSGLQGCASSYSVDDGKNDSAATDSGFDNRVNDGKNGSAATDSGLDSRMTDRRDVGTMGDIVVSDPVPSDFDRWVPHTDGGIEWTGGNGGAGGSVDYGDYPPPDIDTDSGFDDTESLNRIEYQPRLFDVDSQGPRPDAPSVTPDVVVAQNQFSSANVLLGNWRDTSPTRAVRSDDLPLCRPLNVRLYATRRREGIEVRIVGAPQSMTARWLSTGRVIGHGRSVVWHPENDTDQISVAVWSYGGVAVLALRAKTIG